MKILLFGKNGQVGWELKRSLSSLGTICAAGREDVSLEDKNQISNIISQEKPDILVNAAAYTAVDKAESQSELAHKINAEAVEVMAKEIHSLDSWLVHYSTDYVFDGTKQSPYLEEDITSPLSEYGKSKLNGENLIRKISPKHLIFRTSWVYSSHGVNFVKTMLRLAKVKKELKIVSDQYGAPTSAELIADVTALALYRIKNSVDNSELSGTYNLTASGETSWYGFAITILQQAQSLGVDFNIKLEDIEAISTDSYPLPATRPQNSRLNTEKLCNALNITLSNWQHHAQRCVHQLIDKEEH